MTFCVELLIFIFFIHKLQPTSGVVDPEVVITDKI